MNDFETKFYNAGLEDARAAGHIVIAAQSPRFAGLCRQLSVRIADPRGDALKAYNEGIAHEINRQFKASIQDVRQKGGPRMNLSLSAKTNIPDVVIDFIEVKLNNGEEVSLNWDESEITRSETGFEATYKGVCFGEIPASGKLDSLRDLEILDIGLYTEKKVDPFNSLTFQIEKMTFEEAGRSFTTPNPVIPPDCYGMRELTPTITQETLADIIASAQQQTLSLDEGIRNAFNALEYAIDMADQQEAAGKKIHPSIINRLVSAKLIVGDVINDLPKDLSAKEMGPER